MAKEVKICEMKDVVLQTKAEKKKEIERPSTSSCTAETKTRFSALPGSSVFCFSQVIKKLQTPSGRAVVRSPLFFFFSLSRARSTASSDEALVTSSDAKWAKKNKTSLTWNHVKARSGGTTTPRPQGLSNGESVLRKAGGGKNVIATQRTKQEQNKKSAAPQSFNARQGSQIRRSTARCRNTHEGFRNV